MSAGRVLHRVVDQVLHAIHHQVFIHGNQRKVWIDKPLDFHACVAQRRPAHRERAPNNPLGRNRRELRPAARRLHARERQDLLDHIGQPSRFVADHAAVFLRVLRVLHHAVRQVVGGDANHRERRAQLVRDAHGELHLQFRKHSGSLSRQRKHGDSQRQHQQHAEADRHGAPAEGRKRGVERTGAMLDQQLPSAIGLVQRKRRFPARERLSAQDFVCASGWKSAGNKAAAA